MKRFLYPLLALGLAWLVTPAQESHAGLITMTVGTDLAGLNDGDVLPLGNYNTAVGASLLADPTLDGTNGFSGFDNNSPGSGYAGNWNFAGAAIGDPITAASLTFGIYDHDSGAAGDQVAAFTVDGFDLTSELNTIMNASGGQVFPTIGPFLSEYNVYTIDLPATTFASLLDGSAAVSLSLQNGFAFAATTGNNASVDFSTLAITTTTAAVPEPGSMAIFAIGMLGIATGRRRRR